MPSPVSIYRWDDVGAPQLSVNGKPTEIINVLKKVLVEGYGTKDPLGWTVAFENVGARKIAFRNATDNGGSGGYYQVWSSNGSDTNNMKMYHKVGKGMTALDGFVQPGNQQAFSCRAETLNWIIVGCDRAFWVILSNNVVPTCDISSYEEPAWFVGDLETTLPNDTGQFVMIQNLQIAHTNNTSEPNWTTYFSYNLSSTEIASAQPFKMYDANGNLKFPTTPYKLACLINSPIPFTTGTPVVSKQFHQVGILNPADETDFYGKKLTISETRNLFRGFVTGLYRSNVSAYSDQLYPFLLTISGVEFLLIRGYGSSINWIKVGNWYE
ncbi:hypothetical protein ACRN94_01565 [Shewanella baltica]|uniref:hypothetical protein n=1 Tax=Shewanella baltica TaxID=62322 RepID=UPI003D78DF6C